MQFEISVSVQFCSLLFAGWLQNGYTNTRAGSTYHGGAVRDPSALRTLRSLFSRQIPTSPLRARICGGCLTTSSYPMTSGARPVSRKLYYAYGIPLIAASAG